MKKISLKDIKNGLSRDEMRKVSGGLMDSRVCNGYCTLYIPGSGNHTGVCFGYTNVGCGCTVNGMHSSTCRGY